MNITNSVYKSLLHTVKETGELVSTRNHEVKRSFLLPNTTFTETPLVTVRRTAWKKALREQEWFLSGHPRCPEELIDWWEPQLNKEGYLIDGYPEQFRRSVSNYGSFDQIKFILEGLKSNPNSRRLLISLWNPGDMAEITETNNNPNTPTCCFPGWVNVLTKEGMKRLADLKVGELIWDGVKYVKVINFWSKGVQDVHAYNTRKGTLYCTEDHKVFNGKKLVKAKEAKRLHLSLGERLPILSYNPEAIMDGLVVADGVSNNFKTKTKGIKLHIGEKDYDYFNSEISHLIGKQNAPTHNPTEYIVTTSITTLPITYEREVPENYLYGSYRDKVSFLRGYFSGNGYNSTLLGCKATSKTLIDQLQLMLHSVGIQTSVYTTKPRDIEWENGTYTSRESYDLTILKQDIPVFIEKIGFLQKYKLANVHEQSVRKTATAKVQSSKYHSTEEVFDITVDSEEHLFWCDGFTVSNCHSILIQFFVSQGKLHMKTYQRSADMLLGVPHNWIQSWAFLLYLAYHSGLKLGSLTWMWGDSHIYQEESHLRISNEIIEEEESILHNNPQLVYRPTDLQYDWNNVPIFKAEDFFMEGVIDKPVVVGRPKLL